MTDKPTAPNDAAAASNASNASGQAIYRRFRAQTFSQIVGQDAVVTTLRNAVRLDRVGHAFLFVGPRGTGKTSMARILAKAVNCTDLRDGEPCDVCPNCVSIREGRALDVVELDAASNNKVDDMRELVPRVHTAPADLARKVFIIDEVQRIKEGWDVLLKTLEEPPDGVLFVFCTTDPSQIRPAVVSRLQRFTFRPLTVAEIEGKLGRILEVEGRTVQPGAIALIARMADGGMRDAESMLDQVLVSSDDPITEASIAELLGLADAAAVDGFITALVEGHVVDGIGILDALEAEGRDLVAFSEQLVTRLRGLLVERMAAPTAAERQAARPLAVAARRLSGIDASRSGLGGYRWQLELCLLGAAEAGAAGAGPAEAGPAEAGPAEAGPETTMRAVTTAPTTPAVAAAASTRSAAAEPAVPSQPTVEPDPAPGPDAPADPAPRAEPERATVANSGDAGSVAGAAAAIAVEPPVSSTPPDGIDAVREAWPRIVAAIGGNPANRPLVATCRPVEMRDGILVLGFPEGQAFMRDIAERKRRSLEDGIASVMGTPVAVRCVVTNLELVEPVDAGEGDLVAQAKAIFDGELADVEDID